MRRDVGAFVYARERTVQRGTKAAPRLEVARGRDSMERLHVKGLISDPATKARSVRLTEAGLHEAEAAFRRLFDVEGEAAP